MSADGDGAPEGRPDGEREPFGKFGAAVDAAIRFLDEALGPGDRVALTKHGRPADETEEDEWTMQVTLAAEGPGGADLIVTTTGSSLLVVARGVEDVKKARAGTGHRTPGTRPVEPV